MPGMESYLGSIVIVITIVIIIIILIMIVIMIVIIIIIIMDVKATCGNQEPVAHHRVCFLPVAQV